jgi:hypothetical protein
LLNGGHGISGYDSDVMEISISNLFDYKVERIYFIGVIGRTAYQWTHDGLKYLEFGHLSGRTFVPLADLAVFDERIAGGIRTVRIVQVGDI